MDGSAPDTLLAIATGEVLRLIGWNGVPENIRTGRPPTAIP